MRRAAISSVATAPRTQARPVRAMARAPIATVAQVGGTTEALVRERLKAAGRWGRQ